MAYEVEKRSLLGVKEYVRVRGYKVCKVDISLHEHLGRIIEVERMAKTRSRARTEAETVSRVMRELKLEELSASAYQSMMDAMYARASRPIRELEGRYPLRARAD